VRKITNLIILIVIIFCIFSCKNNSKHDIWASEDIPVSEIDKVVAEQMKEIGESYIVIDEKRYSEIEGDVDKGKILVIFETGTCLLGFNKSDLKPDGTVKIVLKKPVLNDSKQKGEKKSVYKGSGLKVIEKGGNIFVTGVVSEEMNKKDHQVKIVFNDSLLGSGTTRLVIKKDSAVLSGVLGTKTYLQIKELIKNHPEIKTLVFENIPGSMNDPVNMHTGRLIRKGGFKIIVPKGSEVASGGVDLFCAGSEKVVESGSKLGIHSWYFNGVSAGDLPENHPAHNAQIKYFSEMMGKNGREFYFHTLKVASSDDIHWMTKDELIKWGMVASDNNDYNEMISDSIDFKYKNETMNLLVEGNMGSKRILIILHGGPGGSALVLNNSDNFSEIMEKRFLIAYWDQRGAGLSTGKNDVSLFTVDQFVDDLDHLIKFLLGNYGKDNKIFLFGASWGGYLGVAYLEDNSRQKKISGWIEMNGVNNFHDNGKTSRSEIVKEAMERVAKGIAVRKWNKIKNKALTFDIDSVDVSEFLKLEKTAEEANSLLITIDKKIKFSSKLSYFKKRPFKLNDALIKDAISINPDISKINIPTLMLWGEYDMVVPLAQGKRDFGKYSSKDKMLKVFKKGGHLPMFHFPEETAKEIIKFVLTF